MRARGWPAPLLQAGTLGGVLRAMSDDKGERKPVAASMKDKYMFVVCDDGSVWQRDPSLSESRSYQWKERLPVPGTRRVSEKAK